MTHTEEHLLCGSPNLYDAGLHLQAWANGFTARDYLTKKDGASVEARQDRLLWLEVCEHHRLQHMSDFVVPYMRLKRLDELKPLIKEGATEWSLEFDHYAATFVEDYSDLRHTGGKLKDILTSAFTEATGVETPPRQGSAFLAYLTGRDLAWDAV